MTTSVLLCNACGTQNPLLATFCMTCGEPLQIDTSATLSSRNLTGLLSQNHLLNQRYRILSQIGRGGFGAVYKAEDTQLGDRQVAIKEMSQYGLGAKELVAAIAAFQHEAQLLASLQHPNLPRIYDYFSADGRWYLVMDFLAGETLENILLRQPDGRLSLTETLDIGLQLCSVLDYLHTRRPPIIFRDLKPANIMRVPPQHLYLIDFGIARHFKPGQTKDTIPFGSPGYAAPEQYGKAQTTQQSDIYSLGVLLHQLLSGEDPSQKPFLVSPLRLYGSNIAELEALITRMTALDAAQRPSNIVSVQTVLQEIAARSSERHFEPHIHRPHYEEIPSSAQTSERVSYEPYQEQVQEQIQEQIPLPPVNTARRKLIIGGLLTGAALAAGSGLLFFSPKTHVKPHPIPTPQPTPAPPIQFGPDTMIGYNAQHTGFNAAETILGPTNVSRLQVAWLSDPIGMNYFSSPTVSGDIVYVCTYAGQLYALDAKTGRTRWFSNPYSTSSSINDSTPAVVKGIVYACLHDGKLHAFDAATGHVRWVSSTDNTVNSSPIVYNGVVYVTGEQTVSAFDASTGNIRWISPPIMPRSFSPVAIANNLVYVAIAGSGAGTGRVYALDITTGQTHWSSDLITNGIDDNSSPTIANGLVYIGTGDGSVVAFDAHTGHTRWTTVPNRGSTGSSPAVANGRVYLSNDAVHAFDAITGQPLWTSAAIAASNDDSPSIANGIVYACSITNNSVYAFDAATGKTLWISPPTKGQLFTTPTVANGILYLASQDHDGTVYAYHLPT